MALKVSDFGFLDSITERSVCPTCKSSRMFFCYDCCRLMPCLVGRIPHVDLPVSIHIVRHPMEKSGKSTGVQAGLLAPDNVKIFIQPEYPDYSLESDKKNAETLSSAADNLDLMNFLKNVRHFVLIDCTWNQTAGMLKDPRLAGLRSLALTSYETRYWRPQHKKPEASLATIEAVYYFCVEYRKYVLNEKSDGEYDDLLFFYEYFRRKVTNMQLKRKRELEDEGRR